MGTRSARRPPSVASASAIRVADPTTERAIAELRKPQRAGQDVVTADLKVGTNAVQHSLGRAPRFVSVSPTVADATFAWARSAQPNPHPDRQVLIDVVGVAQPGATILVS